MMQRNVLASRLGRQPSLPPVLRDERACSACFQRSNCALLHKASLPVYMITVLNLKPPPWE
jgi:hypothetical protein